MDENKVSSGPTITIVILLILIILVSGYIVYEKVYSTDNKNNDSKDVIEEKNDDKKPKIDYNDYEELDINSDMVKTNYNKVRYSIGMCNYLDSNYTQKYQHVSDFSSDLRMTIAYIKVDYNNKKTEGEKTVVE